MISHLPEPLALVPGQTVASGRRFLAVAGSAAGAAFGVQLADADLGAAGDPLRGTDRIIAEPPGFYRLENGRVPSRADQPARREALTRSAARRQTVGTLRLAASMATYSAEQLANGLSPSEATRAALDVAAELEITAASLRRLARLDLDRPARRTVAVALAASGLSQRAIGEALGVSKKTVWTDLRAARR